MRPLKRIATLNPEVLPEDTDPEWTFPYVDIGNVTFEAGITGTELVRFANAPSRARRRVRNGDTIVSTVRTYLRAIAPVWNQPDGLIVSTGFAVIRARPPMDAGYLSWALRSNTFVESVVADSVGVSYPAIAPSVLGSLPVPAPPRAEQRAIADFLDRETAKIDALIAAQERLIALLDEKRQATITHAVTKGLDPNAPMKQSGVEWIGLVPRQWTVKSLKYLASVGSGFAPPPSFDPTAGDYPVYGSNGLIGYCKECFVTGESLVVGRVGASGSVTTVPAQSWVSDNALLLRITQPDTSLKWLRSVLETLNLGAQASRTAQPLITGTFLADQAIPTPSFAEQRAIADFLDRETARTACLVSRCVEAVERLRERRTALITAAVTGQIDVTCPVITEAAE